MQQAFDQENLLCAVMAVQLGLVQVDSAIAALNESPTGGREQLAQLFKDKGTITASQRQMLLKVLEMYLAAYRCDIEQSLASISMNDTVKRMTQQLANLGSDLTVEYEAKDNDAAEISAGAVRSTSSAERFWKIQLHASGGLGNVFLARDEQLKRQVALKELKKDYADNPAKQKRFLLEGEVTGALEHPGIVPVYSLGYDSSAGPFYAMKFIRGNTLRAEIVDFHQSARSSQLHDYNSLTFRRLLQRFVDVCNAIEYAHSRGVLHRDIKPSNIMIGKYGETYVVDWGMACVRGSAGNYTEAPSEGPLQASDLSGSSETRMGSALGTPAFMSPEQAEGDLNALGPWSDVYSLGATLYCVLTNHPPFDGDDVRSVLDRVRVGSFAAPSDVVPQIPKKLEAVCLKAMSTKSTDRYAKVAAMVQDMERWLGDEPVEASPDNMTERLLRFLRRHRTWALAGTSALAVIATVAISAALLVNRARNRAEVLSARNALLAYSEASARRTAEQRFLEARETVDIWITGFTDALRNYPGVTDFRREMLERAASDYERFVAESSDDPSLRLERGRTLLRLGDLRRSLVQPELASESYRQSIQVFSELLDDLEDNAKIFTAKAYGRLALSQTDVGDSNGAEQSFRTAIELLMPLAQSVDSTNEVVDALAAIQINYGNSVLSLNRLEEAKTRFEGAVEILQKAVQGDPDVLDLRRQLATAKLGLGRIYLIKGDPGAADNEFRDAMDFYDAAVLLRPDDPKSLELRASACLYSASAKRQQGNYRAEAELYQMAIKDFQRLAEAQPEVIVYRENLSLTRTDLGQLWLDINEPQLAETELQYSKASLELLVGAYPTVPRFHEEYAVALDSLAHVLIVRAQFDRALSEGEDAAKVFQILSRNFPDVPEYRQRLAVNEGHVAQSRYFREEEDEAIEKFGAACMTLDRLVVEYPEALGYRNDAALVHAKLGDVLWKHRDRAVASMEYEKATQHWNELVKISTDPTHLNNGAWFLLTCPQETIRDSAQALVYARKATAASATNNRFRATLALALFRQGEPDESLQVLSTTDDGEIHEDGRSLFIAAIANFALGREVEAKELRQRAVTWTEARMPGHWELAKLQAECLSEFEGIGQQSEEQANFPDDAIPSEIQ